MGHNTKLKLCLALLALCAAVLVCEAQHKVLDRILHRPTTPPPTTTTTTRTLCTTRKVENRPYFINNNLPNIQPGCTPHYVCSKKLTSLPSPRPCVKYCLKRIECPQNVIIRGKANECVELDEDQVLAQNEAPTAVQPDAPVTQNIMQVAMIDFPCQPGYLPDSRGRCREIW